MSAKLSMTALTAIQRHPRPGISGYSQTFSQSLKDWYSPKDSEYFTKEILYISCPESTANASSSSQMSQDFPKSKAPVSSTNAFCVFVDATELGDVLVLSDAAWTQGVETPTEDSRQTDSSCGQASVFPFYLSYTNEAVPPPAVPPGPPDVIYRFFFFCLCSILTVDLFSDVAVPF